MQITEVTIKIILLFLPGIITKLIIENLTVTIEKRPFYFLLHAYVLGFLSYFTYLIFLKLTNLLPYIDINTDVRFLESLLDFEKKIAIHEIVKVTIISGLNGLFLSYIINRKYFHRFAQKLKITKKFSEVDVWDYVFNSPDNTEWVVVRDLKYDLMYEGWVHAFSDTVKENELFLRDVIVFRNTTGKELYKVPGMYISRNRNDITIEFTALEFSDALGRYDTKINNGVKNHE